MSQNLTRHQLALQRIREQLTVRAFLLDDLQQNLRLPYDNPQRKLIWSVTGGEGTGKTTLLRHYLTMLKAENTITAAVDRKTLPTLVAIMSALAEQITAQGYALEPFNQHYHLYRQYQETLYTDPECPLYFPSTLGQIPSELDIAYPLTDGQAVQF